MAPKTSFLMLLVTLALLSGCIIGGPVRLPDDLKQAVYEYYTHNLDPSNIVHGAEVRIDFPLEGRNVSMPETVEELEASIHVKIGPYQVPLHFDEVPGTPIGLRREINRQIMEWVLENVSLDEITFNESFQLDENTWCLSFHLYDPETGVHAPIFAVIAERGDNGWAFSQPRSYVWSGRYENAVYNLAPNEGEPGHLNRYSRTCRPFLLDPVFTPTPRQ